MQDLFKDKNISPMLLHRSQNPFDSNDYIFEIKFDGARCIAYLEKNKTILKNKRNKDISMVFPELLNLHCSVRKPCILDGELVVMKNGKPNFTSLLSRSLKTNKIKIDFASKRTPASFIAYDILQLEKHVLLDIPLFKRKEILKETIIENEQIACSRYIEEKGIDLFMIAKNNNLEGIVAKKRDSKYFLGIRSKEWLKIKVMHKTYPFICGYIELKNNDIDLILGNYNDYEKLQYVAKIHGLTKDDRNFILNFSKHNSLKKPSCNNLPKNLIENKIHWINPKLKCFIEYMEKSDTGRMRQAIYKGIIRNLNLEI